MIDVLLHTHSAPFSISLAVVLGLFLLEVVSLLLGGSVLSLGSDAPDLDADFDANFDTDFDADLASEVDGGIDLSPGMDVDPEPGLAPTSILSWIGLGKVPFLIWLVSFLTIFGLSGLVIQSLVSGVFGNPLPAGIASAVALVPALGTTRWISNIVAQIMPKTESTAMRHRFLGGHHGVISQGTAKRGKPFQPNLFMLYNAAKRTAMRLAGRGGLLF